jgi:hypothetical protein
MDTDGFKKHFAAFKAKMSRSGDYQQNHCGSFINTQVESKPDIESLDQHTVVGHIIENFSCGSVKEEQDDMVIKSEKNPNQNLYPVVIVAEGVPLPRPPTPVYSPEMEADFQQSVVSEIKDEDDDDDPEVTFKNPGCITGEPIPKNPGCITGELISQNPGCSTGELIPQNPGCSTGELIPESEGIIL